MRRASGRIGAFFSGLESWMMSYAAAVVMSLVLLAWWSTHLAGDGKLPASIVAMLGFMTRDVAIFIALRGAPGRRRGDLAAMGTLFAIYVLAPVIVKGLGADNLLMVFLPAPSQPVWLGPVIAWGEGLALAVFAFSRASIRSTPAGRSQPSPAS